MATIKQKKAFLETGVNGGIISKAMLKAGYSESVSKRTDKLTNTKGWEELMEQHLPDKLLAEKHQELLNAEIIIRQKIKGELVWEKKKIDSQSVSKGLDMGYKLKGKYAPEKSQSVILNLNTELKNSKESRDLVDEYEAKLKNMLKQPKNDA